ncbi:hypothetical protein HDR61_04420 [bacterium]|nr:hypothetical protein [bacterium]
MKPSFIFSVIALAAIVVAASFGVQLSPHNAVAVPENLTPQVLYVCPASGGMWDQIASVFRQFGRYITIGFFFAVMILVFNWGWAMYQNLLNDKFKRESFSNVWKFTKFTFWAGVIVLILTMTPNHFKVVHVKGASGDWTLCEANSPGARATLKSNVER